MRRPEPVDGLAAIGELAVEMVVPALHPVELHGQPAGAPVQCDRWSSQTADVGAARCRTSRGQCCAAQYEPSGPCRRRRDSGAAGRRTARRCGGRACRPSSRAGSSPAAATVGASALTAPQARTRKPRPCARKLSRAALPLGDTDSLTARALRPIRSEEVAGPASETATSATAAATSRRCQGASRVLNLSYKTARLSSPYACIPKCF